ncbi:hypothetical protein GCM10010280_56730 [Streptomyces pilosus]|uniref:Uncharacterized protein n=1 Tax=Streptomyces pilosus TaxID=28893 RepID=A0A918C2C2_9ACTN|nr:hypothetical protein GCM10010280_56730 [Streptomyces pilosus]
MGSPQPACSPPTRSATIPAVVARVTPRLPVCGSRPIASDDHGGGPPSVGRTVPADRGAVMCGLSLAADEASDAQSGLPWTTKGRNLLA